ncbi:MAG: VOC family protein [Ruminococcaceae bacterium]|nr:VOC family protein [Oscillospiraceae bacterium]
MEDEKMIKNVPTGLAHVAIPAGDFTTTVEFYKNLGFVPVVMHEFSCILGNGSCRLEIYRRRVDEKPAGAIDHIALVSENIDAAYEEIVAMGCKVVSNGIESNEMFAPRSNRFFLFLGPNNERIEFAQVSD